LLTNETFPIVIAPPPLIHAIPAPSDAIFCSKMTSCKIMFVTLLNNIAP